VKCEKVQIKLSAYLDGELDAEVHRELADHLKQCPECREELEEFSGLDTLIRGLPRLSLPDAFAKVVVASVRNAVTSEPRKLFLSRAWKALLEHSERFFELLEPESGAGIRSLDEFNDIPASFIGYAYFKALGSQR